MSSARIVALTKPSSVLPDESAKNIPELKLCDRVTQLGDYLYQFTAYLPQLLSTYAEKGGSISLQAMYFFVKWFKQKTDIIHGETYPDLSRLPGGILGQLWAFRDPKGEEWQRVIDEATKLAIAHSQKMSYFWVANCRVVVVASKDLAAEILIKFKSSMHGADSSGIFSDLFGADTLFNLKTSDPRYYNQRLFYTKRFLLPAALDKLTPQIEDIVKNHVSLNRKAIENVGEFSVSLAMDVVARTQLGFTEFDENDRKKLSAFINQVIPKLVASKTKFPWEPDDLKDIQSKGREFFKTLIKKNIDSILAEDSDNALKEFILGGGKALWKKSPKSEKLKLTEAQMRDSLLKSEDVLNLASTFLVVGHETTAKLLESSLCLLAHPDNHSFQNKLRIMLSDDSKEIKQESKVYANKILVEALRLHTVIPTFKEVAEKDCKLSNDYILYKGTMVYIPVAFIHRAIPDGDKFIPEREQSFMNPDCGLIPFGIPPRTCPGRDFSLLEARKLLEFLVLHFRFECGKNDIIKTTKMINNRYDNPITIHLHSLSDNENLAEFKEHSQEYSPGHSQEYSPGHSPEYSPGHSQEYSPGHSPEYSPGHSQECSPGHSPEYSPGHSQECSPEYSQEDVGLRLRP